MNNEPNQNVTTPQWGTMRLRLYFLAPLVIAISIVVFSLSMVLNDYLKEELQEGEINIRVSLKEFYDESIRYDTRALHMVMNALIQDEKLSEALAHKNRDILLQRTEDLFKSLKRDFKITHFYFTGIDRVNLLRVHAPSRYGDVIERITMHQAENTGLVAHGVELGPLGTFTLRFVAPWYDQYTHKLIGYVELGMEIDHVIAKIEDYFGVQVFTFIKKEFLKQEKWESGMRTLGFTPDWDRFPDKVTNTKSVNSMPIHLAKRLGNNEPIINNSIIEPIDHNTSFRVVLLPLYDAGGKAVAEMILLSDISKEANDVRTTSYFVSIVALAVGAVLILFFYWLVGRIGKRIETTEKELHELASHDGLTGLYNHRFFYEMFNNEIERARRYNGNVSLLILDIDHFKDVNDTYGHPAGDEVLRALSKRLTHRMRSVDWICRYGGEEIAVILPETDTLTAEKIAEDLRILVEKEPFNINNNQHINITISIGLSTYPVHSQEATLLVSNADTALYEAKESGRNRVCVYHPQEMMA